MKKLFIILAISVGIITSADATSTVTGCTSLARPYDCGNNCCAANAASCATQCPNIVVTECKGLECENKTFWTDKDDNGLQMRCNTSTDECEYQCKADYYPSGYTLQVGQPQKLTSCASCPSYATCAGGMELPVCNANHYRVTGGTITHRIYSCEGCPSYSTGTLTLRGVSPSGSTSVNQCYIPNGRTVVDDTGTATITGGNCYYEE